jgi:hypothetical protein
MQTYAWLLGRNGCYDEHDDCVVDERTRRKKDEYDIFFGADLNPFRVLTISTNPRY